MSTALAKSARAKGPTFMLDPEQLDLLRSRYPWKVQSEVLVTLQVLLAMHKAGKGKMRRAYHEFPGKPHGRGFNYKSLCRKLDRYLESDGDWTVLVNRAKLTRATNRKHNVHCIELVPAFVDYWRSLCDTYQRKNYIRSAHLRLLDIWYKAIEPIDGYGFWYDYWVKTRKDSVPSHCPDHFLPPGWTYDNLRRFVPSRDERNLSRFGVAAARRELLYIPQTRLGMRFLEWVTLDDLRLDFLMAVPGCDQAVEMLTLIMKDIASDVALRFRSRPALAKEEGGKEGIKRRDVKALLVEFFMLYGYPTDYVMNIIMERGTASMTEAEAKALEYACGGHVKIHFTSMVGGRAVPHGFADRAIGNPSGKSWLESSFNPLHNRLSSVPGQTGATYQLRPLDLYGRQNEQRALERIAGLLPPAQRLKLRIPFQNYQESNLTLEQCLRNMNNRRDHKLEAFDMISIWRWRTDPPAPWMSMADWPANLPKGAEQNIELKQVLETPLERAAKLSIGCHFQKMAASAAYVFLERNQKAVTVDGNIIEVGIDGKTYKFRDEALCETNGAKFLAYFDPKGVQFAADARDTEADLGKLYLLDVKDGHFAGTAALWFGPSRTDLEAHAKLQAEQERVFKRLRKRVQDRNGRALERRIADIERNLELAAEAMPAVQLASPDGDIIDAVPDNATERIARDMQAADRRHRQRTHVNVIEELLNE